MRKELLWLWIAALNKLLKFVSFSTKCIQNSAVHPREHTTVGNLLNRKFSRVINTMMTVKFNLWVLCGRGGGRTASYAVNRKTFRRHNASFTHAAIPLYNLQKNHENFPVLECVSELPALIMYFSVSVFKLHEFKLVSVVCGNYEVNWLSRHLLFERGT